MKQTDPWAKLAAAYHYIGEKQALEKLLNQHPRLAAGIGDLYAKDGQWRQAIAVYDTLITAETTDSDLLGNRAAAHAALEQWGQARADWARAAAEKPELNGVAFETFRKANRVREAAEFGLPYLQHVPNDSLAWLRVATVMARSDDEADYIAFCNWILQQPAETAESADRAIKACLLRAAGIDLATLPVEALTIPLDEGNLPDEFQLWGWGTRALLSLRSGDAESAVKYIVKSEELQPSDVARAMNLAVLALAHQQLNHPDEARQALNGAKQLISRLQANKENKHSHDLKIAEILYREAEAKINGEAKPKQSVPPQP